MSQELSADEKATVARFGIHEDVRGVVILTRRGTRDWEAGGRAQAYIVSDGVATHPLLFDAWWAAVEFANAAVAHRRSRRVTV